MSKYFNGSATIGFTCDNCGRELQGCTWVNGMKFCAKCYQETFRNNTSQFVDLLNKEMYELKIADLEAKLADIEESARAVIDANFRIAEERDKLKQQLADIEEKINMLEEHKFYADNIIQAYADKCKKANQDKISFAVEQLERALDIVENGLDDALKNISLNSSYYNKILDKLDQLIKEIKGE